MIDTTKMRYLPALLILIVLCGIPSLSAGQPADSNSGSHRMTGDSLRMAGDLPGAIASYWRSLRSSEALVATGEDGIAYALASTYALQPEKADSAFFFLEEALPSMGTMRVLHDPDLYFLTRDERWAHLEEQMLDKLEIEVSGAFDRDLARRLFHMRRNEWVGRYHIMLLFRQSRGQSPVLTLLSDAMQERHRSNEADLVDILNEKGWPHRSKVGEAAAYAAGNVLNHTDLETRLKYVSMLEAACEAGEADWSDYAHVLDRSELESGRSQVFGTQMEVDEATGRYVPRALIDADLVEERRAEKGLETLVAQLEKFNAAMKRDFGG